MATAKKTGIVASVKKAISGFFTSDAKTPPRSAPATKAPSKKAAAPKAPAKKAAAKRTLIAPNGDKRLVRRNEKGQITSSDDLGKSLAADVRKPARTKVKSGQGDKGDRSK